MPALPAALRYLPLAIGIAGIAMSVASWRFGEPPAWTLFGPRAYAVVIESRVETGRMGNGNPRYDPLVIVRPETGGDRKVVTLRGLVSVFSSGERPAAEAAVAAYRQGARVVVRPFDDAIIYADRTDIFQISHAIFLSLLSVPIFLAGMAIALPRGRSGPRP